MLRSPTPPSWKKKIGTSVEGWGMAVMTVPCILPPTTYSSMIRRESSGVVKVSSRRKVSPSGVVRLA